MKLTTSRRNYWIRAFISSIIASVFIYHRKLDYYKSMPRKNLMTSLVIIAWSLAVLKEPLMLPIGLVILNLVGEKHNDIE